MNNSHSSPYSSFVEVDDTYYLMQGDTRDEVIMFREKDDLYEFEKQALSDVFEEVLE